MMPNKPHAAKPGMLLSFHAERIGAGSLMGDVVRFERHLPVAVSVP